MGEQNRPGEKHYRESAIKSRLQGGTILTQLLDVSLPALQQLRGLGGAAVQGDVVHHTRPEVG